MHIAVVGGGVTGLVVARELLRRGHQITLIEKEAIGGLAGGFPYPGTADVYLERFYHHIFRSDKLMQQLIWEEGLQRDLIWRPTVSGIIAEGKTWPLRGPVDLLRLRPVGSLIDRLRLGWALFCLKRIRRWETLDSVSCRDFFYRHGAIRGYERLWRPLLRAKFAQHAESASAAFLWGRIVPRAGSRSAGKESLGYLRGGFQRLFLRLADRLRQNGCRIILGQSVQDISTDNSCCLTLDEEQVRCDRIVWTGGLGLLFRVARQGSEAYPDQPHLHVPYVAATVLIMALRKSLSQYYWLNSIDPDISFGAIIEHTHLADPRDYGGEHIVYVVNYHDPDDSQFTKRTPTELLEFHEPSIRRIFPGFCREDICRLFVSQASFASPVYSVGFRKRMPEYRDILPKVDVCNMAQVYPFDRNMNHCVYNAMQYVRTFYGT